MKIIKCTLREYLEKYLDLEQDLVDIGCNEIKNEDDLYDFINTDNWNTIWSYPIEELDYLLDKEQDNKKDWDDEDYEDTYVLLFGRLWEVEQ